MILQKLATLLRTPTMLAKIGANLNEDFQDQGLRNKMTDQAIQNLQKLWDVMIPYERYTLIHDIVSGIKVYADHVKIEFNQSGIIKLLTEAGVKNHESN